MMVSSPLGYGRDVLGGSVRLTSPLRRPQVQAVAGPAARRTDNLNVVKEDLGYGR